NFFERIYGVFFQPKETMADIVRKKPVWQGVLVLILVGLLSSLLAFKLGPFGQVSLTEPGLPHTPGFNHFNNLFFVFIVFASIFINPILYFVNAAIYHFIAEVLGGEMYWKEENEEREEVILGTGRGLYSAVCFSVLPSIFSALISPIITKVSGAGGIIISIIVSIGVFVWVAILNIIAIKENYKLSTGNATLVFFLPAIVVIVIGIIVILILGSAFLGIFSDIMRGMPPMQ
ncbi:MAG: YIP1 family protein, partial [Caldanaerobacter sp.]